MHGIQRKLPEKVFALKNVRTFVTALGEAPDCAAVVADAEMPGYQELCIHLRSDPITEFIPLLVITRSGKSEPAVTVDARLPFGDDDGLARALRRLCAPPAQPSSGAPVAAFAPEPIARSPTDKAGAGEIFDDKSRTDLFRRPEAQPGSQPEWPPPPPNRGPNQDMLDYAKEYAGYFNSLIDALQSPDTLSDPERRRLLEVATLTQDDAEVLLGAVQTSINEALMNKDLERMRVLSAGKNALYDKRQRLRRLLEDFSARPPRTTERRTSPSPSGQFPDPGVEARKSKITDPGWGPGDRPPADSLVDQDLLPDDGEQESLPEASFFSADMSSTGMLREASNPGLRAKKSELTLAAEARDAEKKAARRRDRGPAGPERRVVARPQDAYKASAKLKKPGYGWVWIPAAVLMVLVATLSIIYTLNRAEGPKKKVRENNLPPIMKWVIVEQTGAGIIARPQAEDKENDRISYSVHWYRNGREVTGENTARLRPDLYRPGDNVFVEIVPSDLHGRGLPMRSRELVVKRPGEAQPGQR